MYGNECSKKEIVWFEEEYIARKIPG